MLTAGKVTIFDQIKIYLSGHRAQGTEHRAQSAGHRERTASGVRPAAWRIWKGEWEKRRRRDEAKVVSDGSPPPESLPRSAGGLGWVLV